MFKEIKIADKLIGQGHPPFIIAEMSGNHNQSLDTAIRLVQAAANAGAHAIKIQTYTPDTMTLDIKDGEFYISDKEIPWQGTTLYDLYSKAQTPWDWHAAIFKKARSLNLIPFSTPFDHTAVDFLEDLNVPCYKISSFENTDISLVKKVASTGKPLIISTGMASIAELDETVCAARESGCKDLILLKCTSSYPASPESTNINTIPHLRKLFACEVGLSDHTLGIGVSLASVALGATVIEKHFVLKRSDGGVDSAFSIEPNEMIQLVDETNRAWKSLGQVHYGATEAEKKSMIFRRSLYVVKDLKAGDLLTMDNIRAIRPGFGLPTKFLEILIGKTLKRDVLRGTPLNWNLIN